MRKQDAAGLTGISPVLEGVVFIVWVLGHSIGDFLIASPDQASGTNPAGSHCILIVEVSDHTLSVY